MFLVWLFRWVLSLTNWNDQLCYPKHLKTTKLQFNSQKRPNTETVQKWLLVRNSFVFQELSEIRQKLKSERPVLAGIWPKDRGNGSEKVGNFLNFLRNPETPQKFSFWRGFVFLGPFPWLGVSVLRRFHSTNSMQFNPNT